MRAALALVKNSLIVSGSSVEHPGGITGSFSWKVSHTIFHALPIIIIRKDWRSKTTEFKETTEFYEEDLLHYSSIHDHQGFFTKVAIIIIGTQRGPGPAIHNTIFWDKIPGKVLSNNKPKDKQLRNGLERRMTFLRSPCVKAPRVSSLFATIEANRRSPPRFVKSSLAGQK